jgi:hypothetical protein
MKWTSAAVLLWCVIPITGETGFTALFDGRTLDGWQVDTPNLWSVRDGMIVGSSPGIKYNDFLRTRKHYKDFILKLSFRLVSGQGNSGIQFRSKPVPESHEVSGYQADVGQQYWGCLYDESRRNKVLAAASAEALAKLDKNGWNDYMITGRGNHITLELNGVRSVDYEEKEPGMDLAGFIALQIHGGDPMEVQFRDIRVRELPPER